MAEVKVSELEGAALDWAVAKALGFIESGQVYPVMYQNREGVCSVSYWALRGTESYEGQPSAFEPSMDWNEGGPLIEKHGIRLQPPRSDSSWTGDCIGERGAVSFCTGETALIAAMRALVASKLGEVVEIPEELVSK